MGVWEAEQTPASAPLQALLPQDSPWTTAAGWVPGAALPLLPHVPSALHILDAQPVSSSDFVCAISTKTGMKSIQLMRTNL